MEFPTYVIDLKPFHDQQLVISSFMGFDVAEHLYSRERAPDQAP